MIEQTSPHEKIRLSIQNQLDKQKSLTDRNKLGQFSTPTKLAQEIVSYGLNLIPDGQELRFLDPAIGTGSFYSALLETVGKRSISAAEGYEIDPHYGEPAFQLWNKYELKVNLADFTKANPPRKGFNLLICNPPYVRHHHIDAIDKTRLQIKSKTETGLNLSGLAGLYCYFIALSHKWMTPEAIAGWLVPSEFMDVNYGREIKRYLLDKVTLLRIHRFDPEKVQFNDALVSSAVIWLKNTKPNSNNTVEFTYGGTHENPAISRHISNEELAKESKWTRFPSRGIRSITDNRKLSDLFDIKRGIATGNNKFFILSKSQIEQLRLPIQFFRPILPSSRYINADEIFSDDFGNPILDSPLFLLDCRLPEQVVIDKYPALWSYLKLGKEETSSTYLCKSRKVWFWQEDRKPAPLFCTYMGRSNSRNSRPFRFILNHSKAIVTNTYLMIYPKPFLTSMSAHNSEILKNIWKELNAIPLEFFISEGRVYGGGLHKMEPKELANLSIENFKSLMALVNKKHSLIEV